MSTYKNFVISAGVYLEDCQVVGVVSLPKSSPDVKDLYGAFVDEFGWFKCGATDGRFIEPSAIEDQDRRAISACRAAGLELKLYARQDELSEDFELENVPVCQSFFIDWLVKNHGGQATVTQEVNLG